MTQTTHRNRTLTRNAVRILRALSYITLLLWAVSGCAGCEGCKVSTGKPTHSGPGSGPGSTPTPEVVSLTLSFSFELASEAPSVKVEAHFHGDNTVPRGTKGARVFDKDVTRTLMPGRTTPTDPKDPCDITTSIELKGEDLIQNLMAGNWIITAEIVRTTAIMSSALVSVKGRDRTCEVQLTNGSQSLGLNGCPCGLQLGIDCCTPGHLPQSGQVSQQYVISSASIITLTHGSEQKKFRPHAGVMEITDDNVLTNLEMLFGDIEITQATTGGLIFQDTRLRTMTPAVANFSRGAISAIPAGSLPFKLSFNLNGQRGEQTIIPTEMFVETGSESLRLTSHFDLSPDPEDTIDPAFENLLRLSPLRVDVEILASLASSNQGQGCTRSNPTVFIEPANPPSPSRGTFAYTVTVTNNDSAGCLPSVFNGMADFPELGFRHVPECFRITLRPGESGSRPILIIAAPGVEAPTFREVVTNESSPGFASFVDVGTGIQSSSANHRELSPLIQFLQLGSLSKLWQPGRSPWPSHNSKTAP